MPDPYLAWQLRLALFWAHRPKDQTTDTQELELMEQMREAVSGR